MKNPVPVPASSKYNPVVAYTGGLRKKEKQVEKNF